MVVLDERFFNKKNRYFIKKKVNIFIKYYKRIS
jgi:hypothetical protein